jgi:hypothetical protein
MPAARITFGPECVAKSLHPQLFRGLMVAAEVWGERGIPELYVTRLADNGHKATSLHPKGQAADIRTHTLPNGLEESFRAALDSRVGAGYDVILEAVGTPNEHLHMEWDPK